jgi:Flp pilus assembly protein CpaB
MTRSPALPSGPSRGRSRRLPRRLRRLRARILAHRRPLAALLAALAVAAALQANAAPPPARVPVLTAARDLPPGTSLGTDDVVRVGFAAGTVPDGALSLRELAGRTTVGPVRRGEALTDARVLDRGLLARYPGDVAVPVRVGDAASVDLLRVGDRVSVLAADPQRSGPADLLAESVPVLAIPPRRRADAAVTSGALLLVAADPVTARDLAGAAVASYLSVLLVR